MPAKVLSSSVPIRIDAPTIALSMPDASDRKDRKNGGKGDVPVWLLNTNVLKDAVVGDLARTDPGPGYVHLARWLLDVTGFFDEYEAEKRTDKGWMNPTKARNEAFDLHGYNRGACKILKADKINWVSPPSWARPIEVAEKPAPEIEELQMPQPDAKAYRRQQPARKNWVKGWR